jgi:D-xylose transport system substrate-binding protein
MMTSAARIRVRAPAEHDQTSATYNSRKSTTEETAMNGLKTSSRLALAAALAGGLLGAISAPAAAAETVAFLMPDQSSTRYEEHDHPGFVAEMTKLCADCKVLYQNADGDATKQQQQFNSVITQGAKVIVLDPVDSAAAASLVALAQSQGVKVVAYDRPIPKGKADYYVSFNNEGIGKAIAESLVAHLKATKVDPASGGVLEINGSPTDAAAGLIKKGIHEGLDNSGYPVLAEYDTPDWVPAKAQAWASGQITRFGGKILGVVAANDGTGGGAIAAFKAAGVNPIPPVTGNDATIAALQLIVAGDQYNTISKPSEIVAAAAAKIAVQLLKGETPKAEMTLYDTPSQLFTPAVVTAEYLKAEIIDKKLLTPAVLCAGAYAEGCKKLGITP